MILRDLAWKMPHPRESRAIARPLTAAAPRLPQPTDKGEDVFDALLDDICGREALGFQIHGKPLLTFDGRDWLQEAYEEVLDTAVYLKAALMERAARPAPAPTITGPGDLDEELPQ